MSKVTKVHVEFDSTVIKAISYDLTESTLLVLFQNNGLYTYHEVPVHVFEAFRTTDSAGRFLVQQIKPFYKFTKEN